MPGVASNQRADLVDDSVQRKNAARTRHSDLDHPHDRSCTAIPAKYPV
jgi:hypothetical protein